jgi:hypothetical protein
VGNHSALAADAPGTPVAQQQTGTPACAANTAMVAQAGPTCATRSAEAEQDGIAAGAALARDGCRAVAARSAGAA